MKVHAASFSSGHPPQLSETLKDCLKPTWAYHHHFVVNFTFESISLELFAFKRECSGVAEDLACEQITPAWYGRLTDDTVVSCEDRIQVGVSLLPLTGWLKFARPGRWEQRSSCWDPKARTCHSKKYWLHHFGLIYKFVLSLLGIVNWTTPPPTSHHY